MAVKPHIPTRKKKIPHVDLATGTLASQHHVNRFEARNGRCHHKHKETCQARTDSAHQALPETCVPSPFQPSALDAGQLRFGTNLPVKAHENLSWISRSTHQAGTSKVNMHNVAVACGLTRSHCQADLVPKSGCKEMQVAVTRPRAVPKHCPAVGSRSWLWIA